MDNTRICSVCKKNCCIYPNEKGFIFIGIKDAETIGKKWNLEYKEFLDFSKLKKRTIKLCREFKDANSESRLRMKMLVDDRLLRLKIDDKGRCIFLDKKNQCSIYPIRPLICKIYPYWYNKTSKGIAIVYHDKDDLCNLIRVKGAKDNDIDYYKTIANQIEIETKYYFNNILNFVENNNLRLTCVGSSKSC
jgi:Fe-S-cluster containining protein